MDFTFNVAKGRIAEYAERVNIDNPANSVFKLVAINTTATDAVLKDLNTLEDVLSNPNTTEVTNGGYSRIDVESLTVTVDDTTDQMRVDMDDQTWATVAAGLAWTDVLICYEANQGGADSAIVPLVQLDFPVTPNGMDITIKFHPSGFSQSVHKIENKVMMPGFVSLTDTALGASVGSGPPDLTSSSGDGFHIEWNATGVVQSIKDGATSLTLKSGQDGGFYLRDAANFGTPQNQVLNGDFETGTLVNWTKVGSGTATIQTDSTNYVRLDANAGAVTLKQTVNVQGGHTYILRGRRRGSPAGTSSTLRRWLNLIPVGGNFWKWGLTDPRQSIAQTQSILNPQPTSWTNWSYGFYIPKGVSQITIEFVCFDAGAYTWDIDDVQLEDMDPDSTRMTHTVTAGAGGDVDFSCTGEGCTLTATISEQTDHLLCTGSIVADTPASRVLMLDFCLPLDQVGWEWCANYDEKLAFSTNQRDVYYEAHPSLIHVDRQLPTYPLAAVVDGTRGVCLANSIEQPRHFKPFRDRLGVFMRHHAGLHANRNTFSFKFVIYKFAPPSWHMRSAMKKYRGIFPAIFTDWMVGPNFRHGAQAFYINKSLAPDSYRYGISYDFRGQSTNVGWEANHDDGVAFTGHRMGLEHSVKTVTPPTLNYAQMSDLLDNFESGMELSNEYTFPVTGGRYKQDRHGNVNTFETERQRFVNCKVTNSSGGIFMHDFPNVQVTGTNSSPNCPSLNEHEGELNVLTQADIDAHATAGKTFRGQSHDNCVILAGRSNWNYNAAHFGLMTTDLSWEIFTKVPAMMTAFTYWESLKVYTDTMHGRTPYAISVGNLGPDMPARQIYANVLDAFGGENESQKVATNKSHWRTSCRDTRALAGSRCLTIITHDSYAPGDADLPRLWSLCYTYLRWPSMKGINYQGTAGDFTAADLTECDIYFPTLKILDAAGPDDCIPYATSNTANTYIERYGTYAGGDLHFVVFNDTAGQLSPTFTIDKTALGIPGNTDWTDIKNFGGGGSQSGINTQITVTIPAYRCVVFHVTAAVAVNYATRVEFATNDAAPLANPYNGEVGAITPVETDGTLSVSAGKLSSTTQATPAWGELGFWTNNAVTRAAGKQFLIEVTPSNTNFNAQCGWSAVQSVASTNHDTVGFGFANPANLQVRSAGSTLATILTFAGGTSYQLLAVLRAAGVKLYVKTGAGNWKLAWLYGTGGSATLYGWLTLNNGTGTLSSDRIVTTQTTWIQQPEVADGYTGTNGTNIAGRNSDATTPAEETGGTGVPASVVTGSAEIDTNRCKFTNATQTMVVYESGKANVVLLASLDPLNATSKLELVLRQTDVNNFWGIIWDHTANQLQIVEENAGVRTVRASASLTPTVGGEKYTLRVDADGTTIRARVIVVAVTADISFTSSFNQSATKHGARSETSGDLLEYLEIWDLEPTIPAI